ncbi:unnamed protein product [Rhizoctonia solani]|uniref:Uncharacterized protein n=1 Tax=Rhizoctonia solani TaxID=456999 RepID=A0A8H3GZK2_9AGAM|nr:unnamed protein product [Rhizoctonia solani]
MNAETSAVGLPRKLVVHFHDDENWSLADYMVQTDRDDRPQLVHRSRVSPVAKRSRLDRFASYLRPKQGNKLLLSEVVGAYEFLSAEYALGDEVILLIDSNYEETSAPLINAAEILAKHLHGGSRPSRSSDTRRRHGSAIPASRIPIHCVAVREVAKNTSAWNELETRFPSGIKHIIHCAWYEDDRRCCSTIFDSNGGIISREICFSTNAYSPNLFMVRYLTPPLMLLEI